MSIIKDLKILIIWTEFEKELIIKKFNLKEKDKIDDIEVFAWESNIVFSSYPKDFNFKDFFKKLKEKYYFEKIIDISSCEIYSNSDLKKWDVVLANTFLSLDNKKWLFLDNIVWDNYDLVKFWLILNGICTSLKPNEHLEEKQNYSDIIDNSSYFILNDFLKIKDQEEIIFLKYIFDENDKNLENILNILEFIIK